MAKRDLFRSPPRPWNTGRIIGAKPPFKPKHVWAIRQQLKTTGRIRDLALFDCGIDAKLRGCDLVKLRVSDVAPGGMLRQRATVIQQKTGRPVPFEITDPTREALTAWLTLRGRPGDGWLFPSRSRPGDRCKIHGLTHGPVDLKQGNPRMRIHKEGPGRIRRLAHASLLVQHRAVSGCKDTSKFRL